VLARRLHARQEAPPLDYLRRPRRLLDDRAELPTVVPVGVELLSVPGEIGTAIAQMRSVTAQRRAQFVVEAAERE
jgi:hypothetical protein